MSYDISYNWLKELSSLANEYSSNIIQVAGGSALSTGWNVVLDELPFIDALCYSEGEKAMLSLLDSDDILNTISCDPWVTIDKINEGYIPKPLYEDLSKVISVDYDLVDLKSYGMKEAFSPFLINKIKKQFFIVTSRGCPYKCIFCASSSLHGGKMRLADLDSIEKHIENLQSKYGINVLTIYDDQLLINKERAKKFFKILVKFKLRIEMPNGLSVAFFDEELADIMKEAGVDTIYLAVESGSERVLKDIIRKPLNLNKVHPVVKMLQEKGFFVVGFFIFGLPGETEYDRFITREFIKNVAFDWSFFNYATPLRGSELYNICVDNNWIDPDYNKIGSVDMTEYIINSPGINKEELKKFIFDINLDVNFVNNAAFRRGDYQIAKQSFKEVLSRHYEQPFAHFYLSKVLNLLDPGSDQIAHHKSEFSRILREDPQWNNSAIEFNLINK